MAYADDITITCTHTSTSAAKKYIQPYLHTVFFLDRTKQSHTKSRQNNLHSVHSRLSGIYEQSGPQNKQHCITHVNAHKGFVSYLDPKLTYCTHIHNISVHAHEPLQIIKALTATGWGKQKETLIATYKTVMRPALEYASSIWKSCTHAYMTQTYNTYMTKHSHFPCTRTCSSTPHNTKRKHNIHRIPYTNI